VDGRNKVVVVVEVEEEVKDQQASRRKELRASWHDRHSLTFRGSSIARVVCECHRFMETLYMGLLEDILHLYIHFRLTFASLDLLSRVFIRRCTCAIIRRYSRVFIRQ
jgi:hypothetical protein